MVTNKAVGLLAIIHGFDKRRTRGDGQTAMKELESNNLRVTNDTFRALQATLAVTAMEPDVDPCHYIM